MADTSLFCFFEGSLLLKVVARLQVAAFPCAFRTLPFSAWEAVWEVICRWGFVTCHWLFAPGKPECFKRKYHAEARSTRRLVRAVPPIYPLQNDQESGR